MGQWFAVASTVALAGCVVAPSVPGGPLQGAALQGGIQSVIPVTPEEARLRSQSTGTVRTAEMSGGGMGLRLGGRAGLIDWLDIAGDFGGYEAGAEVRAGLPEGSSPLPLALTLATRGPGPIEDGPRHRREWLLRLEAYPLLDASRDALWHLVLAGGMSFGQRYHELALPPAFDDGDWAGDELGHTSLTFLRDETRVEAALGVELRVRRQRRDRTISGGAFSLVAMPYWVTKAGAPYDASCYHCAAWQTAGYAQSYGVFIYLTASVYRVFFRATENE